MDDAVTLARRWSDLPGPSGREGPVLEALEPVLAELGLAVRRDRVGDLLATRPGPPRRLLVLAPVDEVGAAVTHVDDAGRAWLHVLGDLAPARLVGQRLRFADGLVGAVAERPGDDAPAGGERLYLDLGRASREAAAGRLRVGDAGVPDVACACLPGGALCGKALGSRGAAAAAVRALALAGRDGLAWTVTVAFLAQTEVGFRTVPAVVREAPADLVVALGPAQATDTPKARGPEVAVGEGPVLVVADRGLLASPAAVDAVAEAAEAVGVRLQVAAGDPGTSAAGPALAAGAGAPAATLGFPLRYRHTAAEVVAGDDLEACARVLAALFRRSA
jgi:putative aminopeptidase FrvX